MATQRAFIERMTAEQFEDAFGESEREDRCTEEGCPDLELVDGVVVEGEMPNRRHQKILRALENMLEPWATQRGGGTWANPELRLGTHDVREPDLMAWWSGQPVPWDAQMRAVPDLVVEVISAQPRDVYRDREQKRSDYLAFGVPRYWLVEPVNRTFEALRLVRRHGVVRYERDLVATGGVCALPGMEHFALDLDALWRAAE